ncbi:hypothetical protein PZB74_12660 [Porifericola rhodea]|nr:hypothetical protein [Porifericola rhodea]WKN29818.1 hypothetical protein PZB74_12660 [Porifericola rhodea]
MIILVCLYHEDNHITSHASCTGRGKYCIDKGLEASFVSPFEKGGMLG